MPEVEPKSPKPLLSDETEAQDSPVTSPTEPELRLRLGMPAESEGAADESTGGPGYMQGSELEAADFSESTYERRLNLTVELAPGEPAEGYRHWGELSKSNTKQGQFCDWVECMDSKKKLTDIT